MNKIIIGTLTALVCSTLAFLLFYKPSPQAVETPQNQNPPTAQIANPASTHCVEVGGTLEIKKDGTGSEYGLCHFEDNKSCEEWALLRNECPVGGVKITGYDNEEQMFCAWLGGKSSAEENAPCILPSGKQCLAKEVFNGTCR